MKHVSQHLYLPVPREDDWHKFKANLGYKVSLNYTAVAMTQADRSSLRGSREDSTEGPVHAREGLCHRVTPGSVHSFAKKKQMNFLGSF